MLPHLRGSVLCLRKPQKVALHVEARKKVGQYSGGGSIRNFVLVGSTVFVFCASLLQLVSGDPEVTLRTVFGASDIKATPSDFYLSKETAKQPTFTRMEDPILLILCESS